MSIQWETQLDRSMITTWIFPLPFPLSSSSSSFNNLNVLEQERTSKTTDLLSLNKCFIMLFWGREDSFQEVEYLSIMKLAFAKQMRPESTRIMMVPEVSTAIGYWLISQKISLLGSLPNSSIPGLNDSRINFPNEITTCTYLCDVFKNR